MADIDNTTNVSETVEVDKPDTTTNYIEAIQSLKKNSVSRSAYEELKADNKKLVDMLTNGETLQQEVVDKPKSSSEIRAELASYDSDVGNCQYVKTALELRDALMSEGQPDPFVASTHKLTPSLEDYESADRVATVLRECLEAANGDDEYFTNELQRRTNDVRSLGNYR